MTIRGGLTPALASDFYAATDGPNVARVLTGSRQADITLHMSGDGAYHFE